MLDPISNQVKQWRRLAMECRTYADRMQDAEDRASFARTAENYDRTADKVVQRAAQRSSRSLHAKRQSGDRVLRMQYYLIHWFGQAPFQYSNQTFSTENAATARACSLIGAGELGNFSIKDSEGRVVADDVAIKALCKAASN